jgi:hypothetical protein
MLTEQKHFRFMIVSQAERNICHTESLLSRMCVLRKVSLENGYLCVLGGETPSRIRAYLEFDLYVNKNQLFSLRILPCDCEVRGPCMCKEMPVIPVDRVVDKNRIIRKNGGPRRRRGTRGQDPKNPTTYVCVQLVTKN